MSFHTHIDEIPLSLTPNSYSDLGSLPHWNFFLVQVFEVCHDIAKLKKQVRRKLSDLSQVLLIIVNTLH